MSAQSFLGKRKGFRVGSIVGSTVFAIAILCSVFTTTISSAEAILVPVEEHWKYNVQWIWDDELRMNVGLITPRIIIQNETSDRLEGYIADQNGTRISIYNGEQVVMVRYGYNGGSVSKWQMDGKLYDGLFAIDIPEQYKEADVVGIYIGNHQYTVDNATPYQPQSWVFVNSARMDYERTATDTETATATTSENSSISNAVKISQGSLIDRILSFYGLL